MIKNERQLAATRTQIERMDQALGSLLQQVEPNDPNDQIFRQIQENSIRGQLAELQTEVSEYEDLKSGKVVALELDSIEKLPYALIAGRISSGMTQKDLAERIGIREQMVQRYEATDYNSASFSKMREVALALNLAIREDVLLPSADASVSLLFERLEQEGFGAEFLKKRVIPLPMLSELESPSESAPPVDSDLAVRAAAPIGKILGFTPQDVFGPLPFSVGREALSSARLKAPVNASEKRLAAYAAYARYVANLALQGITDAFQQPLPIDAVECYRTIVNRYGELTYQTVLNYVWDLGIPVVPLNDPGSFHGALWRMGGRNVIVIKQRTSSASRWLISLLHELRHAIQDPEIENLGVLDEMESLRSWKNSPMEDEAVWFALDVALNGQAEYLTKESIRIANGRVDRLSKVVPEVAQRAQVDVGVLADYIAWRVGQDGKNNWWGAAQNLQPRSVDPWLVARNVFWDRVDVTNLNRFDLGVLTRALAKE